MMKELAPIVLFVYNRPYHTLRTLEALSQNKLSERSKLYIYSDGPRKSAEKEEVLSINKVRELVKKHKWCGQVQVIERRQNLGLANNIIEGVTEIVNKYGKVVVLEDDIVTSPSFLTYINAALDMYQGLEEVMHISAYWFPTSSFRKLPDFFFIPAATCWGWGTWNSSWNKFESNPSVLKKKLFDMRILNDFDLDGNSNFMRQLDDNIDGIKDTWAVKWYASIVLNNGLSLHPNKSYTNNIGNDASGTNSGNTNVFNWKNLNESELKYKVNVKNEPKAIKAYKHFFKENFQKRTLRNEIFTFFLKIVSNIRATDEEKWLKKITELPRFIKTQIELPNGKNFEIVDSASFNFMYKEIFQNGIYDFETNTSRPYILDCGANVGLSILYFKQIYPQSEILAFEPDQYIFKTLQKNVGNLKGVQLIPKGLWSSDGRLSFFSNKSDGGLISKSGNYEIDVTKLSSYLNRQVDFLKIDIEGAELEVIQECESDLVKVKKMFLEYHSFMESSQNLGKLISIMENAGFRYYISTPGFVNNLPFKEVKNYKGMDMQLNIFCLR